MRKRIFVLLLTYTLSNLIVMAQDNMNILHNASAQPALSKVEGLRGNGICFTPNKGQVADVNGNLCPDVLYKGAGAGADIYLRKTGISYVYSNMGEAIDRVNKETEKAMGLGILAREEEQKFKDELLQKEKIKVQRVDMDFANCNTNVVTVNENAADGYQNYYYAHCPQGITNVKQYNKVRYKNIYNNIDVSYYGDKAHGIKYDLVVQPHADPNQIKLHWKGAENIHINREGNLVIKTSVNEFYESIPKVYQVIDGKIIDIKARYIINGTTVNFELGTWNPELPLIIDPWATYYGGNDGSENSTDIATDRAGNVLICGWTTSVYFPVLNGFQMFNGGGFNVEDAFVVKFDPAGKRLWATYYGGSSNERSWSITTDIANNVVIAGQTSSINFPTGQLGSNVVFQPVYGAVVDAFVVKLSPAGNRLLATYWGGSAGDVARTIATDNSGNIVITGYTQSVDFPAGKAGTNVVFQAAYGGGTDAFVVKFDPAGSRLWSTYYGGPGAQQPSGIATDIAGNVVFTGSSVGVIKFDPSGILLWSTTIYYGFSIATDNAGNVIVAGGVNAFIVFPVGATAGNVVEQPVFGGSWDAFVVKFDAAGTRLWATYYGGAATEGMYYDDVAIDGSNNIYLCMEAEDVAVPTLVDACSYQPIFNAGSGIDVNNTPSHPNGLPEDQQIVKFAPNGKKLCATYMGGPGEDDLDAGGGIAIYNNTLYITGWTDGSYPVTAGAFQTSVTGAFFNGFYNGYCATFVASVCTNICESKTLGLNYTANTTSVCANAPVTFTPSVANSCDTTGYIFHWTFTGGNPASSDSVKPTVTFSGVGTHDVKLVLTTVCKKDSITKINYITVDPCVTCNLNAQFTKGASNCTNCGCKQWIMINATGGTSPYSYTWPDGYDKRYKNQLCPGTYTVKVVDKNGCSINVNLTAP